MLLQNLMLRAEVGILLPSTRAICGAQINKLINSKSGKKEPGPSH